jgi:hypothetical protein
MIINNLVPKRDYSELFCIKEKKYLIIKKKIMSKQEHLSDILNFVKASFCKIHESVVVVFKAEKDSNRIVYGISIDFEAFNFDEVETNPEPYFDHVLVLKFGPEKVEGELIDLAGYEVEDWLPEEGKGLTGINTIETAEGQLDQVCKILAEALETNISLA